MKLLVLFSLLSFGLSAQATENMLCNYNKIKESKVVYACFQVQDKDNQFYFFKLNDGKVLTYTLLNRKESYLDRAQIKLPIVKDGKLTGYSEYRAMIWVGEHTINNEEFGNVTIDARLAISEQNQFILAEATGALILKDNEAVDFDIDMFVPEAKFFQ